MYGICRSTQVDQRKVGKLALAIQVAFQDLGVFPATKYGDSDRFHGSRSL
jgi:hypothetical protein